MSHTERYAKDKISKQTGHLRFTRIKFSQGLTYWDTEFLTGVENFNEIILEFHPTQWQWNLPSTSKLTVFVPTCALVNHLKLCLALGTTMSVLTRSVLSNSVIPRTVAHQAPLSMGFSREEYWSGLLCPPLVNLLNPGIKPRSSALQADSLLA